ncbi:MAG: hypothetical protein R3B97_09115 [Dehalococcoidia bacterium]|nr:hypothetical protein [Dehalococcoidia bacterium]MCB9486567.1 hypothetical protein [Thermoflexaceae bacterium]
MKEQIVELVTEKAGIDATQAEAAVDAVLGFLKDNPADVKGLLSTDTGSSDLRDRIGDAREKIGPVAEKGKEALGEAKDRIAPVASQAGEKIGEVGGKVAGRLKGFLKRGDDDKDDDDLHEDAGATSESEENTTPANT